MKKRILSVVLTVAMVLASLVYQPAIKEVKAAAWNLVWSDEFDGNSLDTGVWTRETGGSDGGGWGIITRISLFYVTVQNISEMKNQTMQTCLQQDEFFISEWAERR